MTNKFVEKIEGKVVDIACEVLMRGSKKKNGRSPYNSQELKLVRKALYLQNLFSIDGQMIPSFEKEFAFAYNVPYAVASTSGTAAIHTALGALDLNSGDEVITAPITDMGTVAPILMQNAIPVFADIDDTFNIDPVDVERKITARTQAIIAVHLFGNPCNMDALVDIAKRHKIVLIEDCAQAHMTEYKGKKVGSIGDIGCFSFMQSKHMTTGEGGMTITSNKAYYERMKFFVDKGYARKGWGPRAYLFLAPNYRPTELVGAIGLAQLKKVGEVVKRRHELGEYMSTLISGIDGVKPAPVTLGAQHSYWLYPIVVDEGIDSNLLAKEISKDVAWASAGYTGKPIYLCSEALTEKKTYGKSQCPFNCKFASAQYEYKEGLCPCAEQGLKRLICLPLDETWTNEYVKHAADVLVKCVSKFTQKGATTYLTQKKEETTTKPTVGSAKARSDKIRIGIVGCGQMGRWHLDSYKSNPRVEVVAFADTDFAKAQMLSKEASGVAYESHKAMIQHEKLDGVSVCTVPSTHRDIVVDMLNTGVEVLCEKPLAISPDQAQEMVDAAKNRNLLVLAGFKFRFFEEVSKAKEIIQKGEIGKILNFRLMFGGNLDAVGSWYSQKEVSGGGVIMDNGSHAVDLVRYLFGEVKTVSALINTYQAISVEDTAKLSLFMEGGFFGTIDLSWNLPVPSSTYLEIYGEDGTILLKSDGIAYKFKMWNEWKTIPNQLNVKEAFSRQINHFVDSIVRHKSTIVNNEDGLRTQIILEAAYKSAMIGKPVVMN
jgi:perosamine synthetase